MKWEEELQSRELTTQNLPLCMGRSLTSGKYTDFWPWHNERLLSVFGRFSSFPWYTLRPVMNNASLTFQRSFFLFFFFCLVPSCFYCVTESKIFTWVWSASSSKILLPHCVTAMSCNLQMCIVVGKWTGSQFWQVATRIDDWNDQIFCTNKPEIQGQKHLVYGADKKKKAN